MTDLDLPGQGSLRPRRIQLVPFSSGSRGGTVLAYLGIPFAQPATGSNRWKVPQGSLPIWTGTRESQWANDPYQDFATMEGLFYGRNNARNRIKRDEDCFYLNVWVPQGDQEKKPVMVWIYGGSFVVGNTSRPLYDGARLANESGCIVVSLPYRVGAMGFLGCKAMAHEGLGQHPLITLESFSSSSPPSPTASSTWGNWGLWDLVTGLLWVQHSIQAFGGDKANITLFGQSAGSIAIHYLLLSPVVPEGLFQRAILQSGVAMTIPPKTPASAQATFEHLVKTFVPSSVKGEQAQLEYLRTNVTADQISGSLRQLAGRRPQSEYTTNLDTKRTLPARRQDFDPSKHDLPACDLWGPIWDGEMVPTNIFELSDAPLANLRNGQNGIMIGYVVDEGSMFNMLVATTDALDSHISAFPPCIADDIAKAYTSPPTLTLSKKAQAQANKQAYISCATYTGDALFHAPIASYMRAQLSSDSPVYGYVFGHHASEQYMETICSLPELAAEMGCFHSLELGYVFGFDGLSEHTWEGQPPAGGGGYDGKGEGAEHANDAEMGRVFHHWKAAGMGVVRPKWPVDDGVWRLAADPSAKSTLHGHRAEEAGGTGALHPLAGANQLCRASRLLDEFFARDQRLALPCKLLWLSR